MGDLPWPTARFWAWHTATFRGAVVTTTPKAQFWIPFSAMLKIKEKYLELQILHFHHHIKPLTDHARFNMEVF